MKRRKIYFFTALSLTLATLLLLASGSSLLTLGLDTKDTIPLGTLITGIGIACLPLSIYWGIRALRKPKTKLNTVLSTILKITILLGILWVPLSYLLSGNLSFTFSEKESFQGGQRAMKWFWRLSYGIGVGSGLVLIVYWIALPFRKK